MARVYNQTYLSSFVQAINPEMVANLSACNFFSVLRANQSCMQLQRGRHPLPRAMQERRERHQYDSMRCGVLVSPAVRRFSMLTLVLLLSTLTAQALSDMDALDPGSEFTNAVEARSLETGTHTMPDQVISPGHSRPRIVMVTANLNKARELEVVTMLKSVFMHAQCGLHIDFLVSNSSDVDAVRSFFTQVHSPRHASSYAFTRVPLKHIASVVRSWNITPQHHSGYYGMAKFFLADALPHAERAMFLDTDLVAGSDVCMLWSEFERFHSDTLLALPVITNRVYETHCSGIGLAHLNRMRRAGWSWGARVGHTLDRGQGADKSWRVGPGDTPDRAQGIDASWGSGPGNTLDRDEGGMQINLPSIFGDMRARHSSLVERAEFSDQTMFSAVARAVSPRHPNAIMPLPPSWNILCTEPLYNVHHKNIEPDFAGVDASGDDEGSAAAMLHRQQQAGTTSKDANLFFGLLHYNCGAVKLSRAWKNVLEYYRADRLAWLNEGRREVRVREIPSTAVDE